MPFFVMTFVLWLTAAMGGSPVLASPEGGVVGSAHRWPTPAAVAPGAPTRELPGGFRFDAPGVAQQLPPALETPAGAPAAPAVAGGKDPDHVIAKLEANLARQQANKQRVMDKAPETAKPALRHAMEMSQKGLRTAIERHKEKAASKSSPPSGAVKPQAGPAGQGKEQQPDAGKPAPQPKPASPAPSRSQ